MRLRVQGRPAVLPSAAPPSRSWGRLRRPHERHALPLRGTHKRGGLGSNKKDAVGTLACPSRAPRSPLSPLGPPACLCSTAPLALPPLAPPARRKATARPPVALRRAASRPPPPRCRPSHCDGRHRGRGGTHKRRAGPSEGGPPPLPLGGAMIPHARSPCPLGACPPRALSRMCPQGGASRACCPRRPPLGGRRHGVAPTGGPPLPAEGGPFAGTSQRPPPAGVGHMLQMAPLRGATGASRVDGGAPAPTHKRGRLGTRIDQKRLSFGSNT
jgi:hypothetical protein